MLNLEKALGTNFKDISILKAALVHTSYVNENPGAHFESNERLEFLGDAVLGLIVAGKLYAEFPDYDEGRLTRLRAELVREDTLTRIASGIGLGDYLYLGKGEASTGGREKPANLGSAMEAIIAAIYLDRGIEETAKVVDRLFSPEVIKAEAQADSTDFKSRLQEYLQSRHRGQPEYVVLAVEGPDHAHKFTVDVRAGETVLGKGTGLNKKAAETAAAKKALEKLEAKDQGA